MAIHRTYDWFDRLNINRRPLASELCEFYAQHGIDMFKTNVEHTYWWDREILRLFREHGVERFAGLDVWDTDWEKRRQSAVSLGIQGIPDQPISPPTGGRKAFALRTLKRTTHSRFRLISDRLLDWFVV